MKHLFKICSISILALLFSTIVFAQDSGLQRTSSSRYLISAKAGGVNYIQGKVTVKRKDSTSGYLVKGNSLTVGERVITSRYSKAEILLNPGSYVRLDQESEFEFLTTSLDNLKLKLHRGSAIFEVYAGNGFTVNVKTPTARFYLVKSGVYRIDVLENGLSKIEVRRGKAQLGDFNATKLKKGKAAIVNNGQVAVSSFKRKDRDEFENWSRSRAKGLAKANAKLQRNNMRSALWNGYRSNRWNPYSSFGVWAYSPMFGSYCFLPFGYGWRSPYGFNLSRDLFYFRLPRTVYYYRPVTKTTGTTASSTNTGGTSTRPTVAPRRTPPKPSGVGGSRSRAGRTPSTVGGIRRVSPPRRTTPAPRPSRPSFPSQSGRRKVTPRNLDN